MADKEAEKEIERIYVIPLRKIKLGRSSEAAPHAVKEVKSFLVKHMKVTPEDVWIDDSVNKLLWSRGKYKIPSKIRIRAVKFEDGVVEATIPEITEKKSRRELLKEEKEKKAPILRRDEEVGEQADISGTEDYDIAPTADGDVKIKKKKAPKKESEKKPAAKKEDKKPAKKAPKAPAKKKEPAKKTSDTKKTSTKKAATKKSPAKKKAPAKKTADTKK